MKILRAYKNDYERLYIVVDYIPEITYEKSGKDYIGSATMPDGTIIFSDFLKRHSCRGAFCGAEITLNMKDGSKETIQDYWHPEGFYSGHGDFVTVGCGTLDGLRKCCLYSCYDINKVTLDKLLDEYLKHNDFCTYREIENWVMDCGE